MIVDQPVSSNGDGDPQETSEWVESLQSVLQSEGPRRASFLLDRLIERGQAAGAGVSYTATTPYINTILPEEQPDYPGDRDMERRIKSIIRWNAMAMVVRANKHSPGIGGHISTYASCATLYEVAFNHFFRGKDNGQAGDHV